MHFAAVQCFKTSKPLYIQCSTKTSLIEWTITKCYVLKCGVTLFDEIIYACIV